MTETAITVDAAPAFDLDPETLGSILRRLPAISSRVGHNSPQATLGYDAAVTPEAEFVHDIFTLSTSEMVDKW